MPYVLGIDIGGSTTTAAVCRLTGPPEWGPAQAVPLDDAAAALPAVLGLTSTGEFVANGADDDRPTASGFLRRVGDDAPLLVGDASYWAQDLVAALARWVVDVLWEREQAPAEQVAVTHPTGWGGYRRGLLDQALRETGLTDVALVPKARAVAECCAQAGGLPANALVAVYRLGGLGVETSLVARTGPGGYELLASAELDEVGGADLWGASAGHARSVVGATVDLLVRTVRSSGVAHTDLTAVLLAGGAVGAPLVAELISDALGAPVLSDDDPQFTIARGAALVARRAITGEPPAATDARRPARPPVEVAALEAGRR